VINFEEGQEASEKDIGEEQNADPVSPVEKFPYFDYEETIEVFDAVMGKPEMDAGTTIEELKEEPEPDIEEGMHKDEFFTMLSNNRRRTVLRYIDIKSDEAPFSLGELSEVVAAQENDKERKELTSSERKKAYVGLYQAHLPDMDEIGLIDFDSDRGLIDFPEEGNEHVFESINELLEDGVYPDDQMVDEEYFEKVFTHDEDDERYLSRLRQKFSLSGWR